MRIAVIGNGIAGINVAASLKTLGGDAVTVVVYSKEIHPFYSRVRLPEVIAGESTPEDIRFYPEQWYEKKGFTVRLGTEVRSIDRAAKQLILADGTAEHWDALVLATGARSNCPAIPGVDLPGVFTLRTVEDALAIRGSVTERRSSASVIGGGLLGLETARALTVAGSASVRVFEIFPHLLPRQLDDQCAQLLSSHLSSLGIEVVCLANTEAFLPSAQGDGRAASIKLKDGRSFSSDTTILSMGVTPCTDLAREAGLTVNRGIVVDDLLRTSDPSIWAVGDCAEFAGVVWGIIPAALEQVPVAARAILATQDLLPQEELRHYAQTIPNTTLKITGVDLTSMGKAVLSPDDVASGRYQVYQHTSEAGTRYEKFVLENVAGDGLTVCGVILWGSREHLSAAKAMLGTTANIEEIKKLLEGW